MKLKKTIKNLIIALVVTFLIIVTAFCTYAVGEEGEAEGENTPQVTVAPVTEAPVTSPPATEPPVTYAPETEPQVTYAPVTEAPTYAPETYAPATEAPATYATYGTIRKPEEDLPAVEKQTSPTAVRVDDKKIEEKDDLTYGYVSWACVILGIIAVIVVLISNKTHYSNGSGKYRYDSGNMMTGNNHLLNEDYYKNRKTNSYRRKDSRR